MIQKKLQQIKSENSVSLYDHLKQVLSGLLLRHPKNAFKLFEDYSFNLKDNEQQDIVYKVRQSFKHLEEYEKSNRNLLKRINTGTEEEPVQPKSINYIPNIMQQNKLFEKVGVGIGQDEAYKVYKSLVLLGLSKSPDYLKFWGKILGQQNYYIAEGVLKGDGQDGLAANVQPKGTGINTLNYWVTTSLTKQWVQLPTITPQQLNISRKVKYVFKGDLNVKVITNPNFPGTQAHLLKCQIVRISSASNIVPRLQYTIDPDENRKINPYDKELTPDDQGYTKQLATSDLSQLSNWVHYPESILKNGRIQHFIPESIEAGGQEEQKYRQQQKIQDPFEIRLKPISEDKVGRGWKVGVFDQNNIHYSLDKNTVQTDYSITYLKNLNWPGWTTIYHLNNISNFYIGYGFKAGQLFSPIEPDSVFQERQDLAEAQDQ